MYRFRVKAYTPETMPLKRLAQYLGPLAELFGVEGVHLVDIQEGSHASALLVGEAFRPEVEMRLAAAGSGGGDPSAERGYKKINALLLEDNTNGAVDAPDGAEILYFPGAKAERPRLRNIRQPGTFDGVVETLGGPNEWVPVGVRTFEGEKVTGFRAQRELIKELASKIYEPVRLSGDGYYSRGDDGIWSLDRFNVHSFSHLEDISISEALSRARLYGRALPTNIVDLVRGEQSDEVA